MIIKTKNSRFSPLLASHVVILEQFERSYPEKDAVIVRVQQALQCLKDSIKDELSKSKDTWLIGGDISFADVIAQRKKIRMLLMSSEKEIAKLSNKLWMILRWVESTLSANQNQLSVYILVNSMQPTLGGCVLTEFLENSQALIRCLQLRQETLNDFYREVGALRRQFYDEINRLEDVANRTVRPGFDEIEVGVVVPSEPPVLSRSS